jgi:hypothetical protein
VIDITDNISADNEIFGFAGRAKSQFQAGNLQADKSYILSVKPYPANIEIKTVKTFLKVRERHFAWEQHQPGYSYIGIE